MFSYNWISQKSKCNYDTATEPEWAEVVKLASHEYEGDMHGGGLLAYADVMDLELLRGLCKRSLRMAVVATSDAVGHVTLWDRRLRDQTKPQITCDFLQVSVMQGVWTQEQAVDIEKISRSQGVYHEQVYHEDEGHISGVVSRRGGNQSIVPNDAVQGSLSMLAKNLCDFIRKYSLPDHEQRFQQLFDCMYHQAASVDGHLALVGGGRLHGLVHSTQFISVVLEGLLLFWQIPPKVIFCDDATFQAKDLTLNNIVYALRKKILTSDRWYNLTYANREQMFSYARDLAGPLGLCR
tara:strand:+ start:3936 stop:4817 length:882 start_codon:yes stop_codon:yes gene_type:complete